MILRDLDVLAEAAGRADVSVTFSVPTLDERGLAHDRARHAASAAAARGARTARAPRAIDASVGMAPILPGLSDRPEQLAAVVRAAREAGATGIWANVLNLRPGTREHFLEHLAQDWPEQLERYERLYARRAYLRRGGSAGRPPRGRGAAASVRDRRPPPGAASRRRGAGAALAGRLRASRIPPRWTSSRRATVATGSGLEADGLRARGARGRRRPPSGPSCPKGSCSLRVTKIGPSPLPGDSRPCAYTIAAR